MPHIQELHEDLSSKGFQVISINTEPENTSTVREFIKKQGLTFPVYIDSGAMIRDFKVNTFPTLLVVDRRGVIRDIHVGAISLFSIRQNIEALLASE